IYRRHRPISCCITIMRKTDRAHGLTAADEALSRWDSAGAADISGERKPPRRKESSSALLQKVTAERDQARQALQITRYEAGRRQEEFLSTLVHELRNPLASIRTAVQIMRMRECDQATASSACAMIERQLKYLVQFIDELLDVSRIVQGKLELLRARVDL